MKKKQLNTENVFGLHSGVWGDFKNLKGSIHWSLAGDVSHLSGDLSNVGGDIRVRGNVTNVIGDISHLSGHIRDLKGKKTKPLKISRIDALAP